MSEQPTDEQLFLDAVRTLVKTIRSSLCGDSLTLSQLTDSAQAATAFNVVSTVPDVDSFCLIVEQLEIVFNRHLIAQTLPNKLELELVVLAIDWLTELTILFAENLPEPKSLVSELLYTFKLVESSQEAVTLAELVASHAEGRERVDPFAEDPEISVKRRTAPQHRDPFADDPGFGLEFDLLQRTVTLLAESRLVDGDSVPLARDGSKNNHLSSISAVSEHDLFADDPPLSK
ncbi:MAG: hypothetical protein KAG93_01070 [Desulfuromusa sp.]|nr:hypothetical protein [Desulfuromusa sp.]